MPLEFRRVALDWQMVSKYWEMSLSGFGLPFPTAAPHSTAYSSRVVSACSNEIIINQTFNSELQLQFGYTLDENSQHIAFTVTN